MCMDVCARAHTNTHLAGWARLLEAKVVTDNTQSAITSVIVSKHTPNFMSRLKGLSSNVGTH